ncbi:MAG: ARMT1-like domain-containing protein [Thermodesulfovibrionales bacterium]|nr:ARMT1-like domain-containing protein [Thermodesulfovibrionales bacterium]
MKTHLDCFPCFLKQTIIALNLATDDKKLQFAIIKEVSKVISQADITKPPAFTTTFMHRKIRHMLKKDPFATVKRKYNSVALSLYPELKKLIWQSNDPLMTATRLSIAGNVIDFGIYTTINIHKTIKKALEEPLTIDDFTKLKALLNEKKEILYLLDNSGEIVFDKLLIEVLINFGFNIKAVTKGEPVLNDSTIEDAEEVGLTETCEVITNDSDCIGTILEMTSDNFKEKFSKSELIISKGQGNFETLTYQFKEKNNNNKDICYLFQSKCEVVSRELGLPLGSMILKVN